VGKLGRTEKIIGRKRFGLKGESVQFCFKNVRAGVGKKREFQGVESIFGRRRVRRCFVLGKRARHNEGDREVEGDKKSRSGRRGD